MGKGDKRSRRGKIFAGTFGNTRPRNKTSERVAIAKAVAAKKAAEEGRPKKAVPKKAEKADAVAIAAAPAKNFGIEMLPSEKSRQRVEDLLEREKSNELSGEEKAELDHYMQLEHLMRLAKAGANDQIYNG